MKHWWNTVETLLKHCWNTGKTLVKHLWNTGDTLVKNLIPWEFISSQLRGLATFTFICYLYSFRHIYLELSLSFTTWIRSDCYQCFTSVSTVFHQCFPDFHKCLTIVSPLFQKCIKSVTKMFQKCFKVVCLHWSDCSYPSISAKTLEIA